MGDKGDSAGELWRCLIPAGSAKALLTGPDGRPTAVEHAFGKGRALYYGSAVALGYLHREDPRGRPGHGSVPGGDAIGGGNPLGRERPGAASGRGGRSNCRIEGSPQRRAARYESGLKRRAG